MPRLPAFAGTTRLIFSLLLFFALIAPSLAATPTFPALTGRVVDEAGLLSPQANAKITEWLAQFEAATKRQVVVVTVKSLQGNEIEDYGYQLGRAWGIGEKDKNTGALLLVAPTEHKVRIEVGYGLEGELTDAASSTIINQTILPLFRQGKYEDGIVAGTAAILNVLGWQGTGTDVPQPPVVQHHSGPVSVVSIIFNLIPFLLFAVMFIVFVVRAVRHHNQPGGIGMFVLGSLLSGGGSSGGSSFGGGSSFSGGGGSFGGGGASGSW